MKIKQLKRVLMVLMAVIVIFTNNLTGFAIEGDKGEDESANRVTAIIVE